MKYTLLLFIIINCTLVNGQTISGIITDSENEAIGNATVLIKKTNNPNIVYQFTATDEKGFYSIKLPFYLDSLLVEINSISHEPGQKSSFNIKKGDYPLQIDFILFKKAKSLKEVIILAKEKPIKVKNDTTTYNPKSFKDGTEKVVEDLLKKLPGVKVESNGEIKFKGKSIKKMLLDGDDLFDSQYVVGSKNIDINMVESIQAIENFNENQLLKGISDSDEVALNIKLKKGETDFSGNAKIGYGLIDKYDSSFTGLLLTSKNKSFGLLSHNNIGTNNSPYNFQSDLVTVENLKEESLISKDIIKQGNFSSQLEDSRANLNNIFYANFNTLHKVSKTITSRLNFGFYDDKLSRSNSTYSDYNLPNNSFVTSEKELLKKNPQIISGNFQLLSKQSHKSNWEYLGKVKYQDIDFRSLSTNNYEIQSNIVKSRYFFTKHTFNLTNLINQNSVLISSVLYSKSNSPQKYQNTPGISIDDNAALPIVENKQTSNFRKEVINVKLDFLSTLNKFKTLIQTGFNAVKNDYNSSLTSLDSNNHLFTNTDFRNDLIYTSYHTFTNSSMVYKNGKNSFKAYLGIQYHQLGLKDNIYSASTKKGKIILPRNLKFIHTISNKSTFIAGYSYDEAAPKEYNVYNGIIQTSYRNFQNNEINLAFLKTHAYSLMFNYNDFYNLKRFQTILNYNYIVNNYLNKTLINPDTTTTTTFLSQTSSKDYSIIITGEKYIHFIRTTLQANSSYSISFYNDVVNNSDIRDVENKNLNIDITLRTGFKSLINLEAKTFYNNNVFMLKDSKKNHLNALNQSLKVIYKARKNIIANTFVNFISNDLSINSNYLFLDGEVTFTSKNKKIEYSILARNLTNNRTFETVAISDYYKSVSSERLIDRYIIATISFKI